MKKNKCIYYIFLSFFICRLGIFYFLPEQLGIKKGIIFAVIGALIDLLPMVLIAILWKKYGNKILKILFYSYGCLALVYNVANLCVMSSSLKIIDFDLMLQIVDSLFIFFTSVGWIYCFVLGGY